MAHGLHHSFLISMLALFLSAVLIVVRGRALPMVALWLARLALAGTIIVGFFEWSSLQRFYDINAVDPLWVRGWILPFADRSPATGIGGMYGVRAGPRGRH